MHFYQLVQDGFYNDSIFFRVLPWVAQFGLPLPGHAMDTWGRAGFLDDKLKKPNSIGRGKLVFDTHGGKKNRRATQALFLTGSAHAPIPGYISGVKHYVPFAEVIDGMDVIDAIHQHKAMEDIDQVFRQGNKVLLKADPHFSKIKTVRIVRRGGDGWAA
jgi:cyclophilin family peptidyl-prolyl cis-trans isomerase